MITVIVPIYNVERHLRRCVDSILAQTFRDLEVILVDDGSTDGCPRICDGYAAADPRVRVIHQNNEGVSAARNAGLDAAAGDYIGFVDGDDSIRPEMYERLLRACEEHDVPVAMCGREAVDEDGRVLYVECCPPQPGFLSAEEALRSLLLADGASCDSSPCDKLYRRSLFEGIRFPLGVRYEDQIVMPRLLYRAERTFHVGRPLYVYLKWEGCFTLREFHEHTVDETRQSEAVKAFVEEHFPGLQKEAAYFAYFKAGFPLDKAARCGDPEMKRYMLEVMAYSRRSLPLVLGGALTLKHKIWYLKNCAVLAMRLWRWRDLP